MVSSSVYSLNYDTLRAADHRAGRCEMDSHADTCVAGSNRAVLEFTGRTTDVEAYSPDYTSKTTPIATVSMAYDCPSSGATFVFIINEALYFGDSLHFTLRSSNQLRDNDLHVDERHRQHAPDSIFDIFVPSTPLRIPFSLEGVIAGLETRPPAKQELDDTTLHLELTSDIEWTPGSFALSLPAEQETNSDTERRISSMRARRAKILDSKATKYRIQRCTQTLSASTQSVFEVQRSN
jgi:hypothetical protein